MEFQVYLLGMLISIKSIFIPLMWVSVAISIFTGIAYLVNFGECREEDEFTMSIKKIAKLFFTILLIMLVVNTIIPQQEFLIASFLLPKLEELSQSKPITGLTDKVFKVLDKKLDGMLYEEFENSKN
jgi:hypothetical protein